MNRRIFLSPMFIGIGGIFLGVFGTYVVMDASWSRYELTSNMEYKAHLSRIAVMTLARLRTGPTADAISYLDEYVDRYLVAVPMGFKYPELTDRCQNALALAKMYRSRFASPKSLEEEFHLSQLWGWTEVPDLPANHPWLDEPMKRIARIQPAGA